MDEFAEQEMLDIIETLADKLGETSTRLAAAEDTLFVLNKIFATMDDTKFIGAIEFLAKSRREGGKPEIAKLHDEMIEALTRAHPQRPN